MIMGVIHDLLEFCEDERKEDPNKQLSVEDWKNKTNQHENVTPAKENDKPKSLTLDSD